MGGKGDETVEMQAAKFLMPALCAKTWLAITPPHRRDTRLTPPSRGSSFLQRSPLIVEHHHVSSSPAFKLRVAP